VNNTTNGKKWIVLALGMVGLLLTIAFSAGAHIGNVSIHEDSQDKQDSIRKEIDRSLDREVLPRLETIEGKLDEVLKQRSKP